MPIKSNHSRLALAALVALLFVVINPELRALLLMTEAIGTQFFLFVLLSQVQGFWSSRSTYARQGACIATAVIATIRRTLRLGLQGLFPRQGLWLAAAAVRLTVEHGARALLLRGCGRHNTVGI